MSESGDNGNAPVSSEPQATESSLGQPSDRTELIARAKSFLQSTPVQHQNLAAKRQFLFDKGLSEPEVLSLLSSTPHSVPSVPPRTYPQPAPSNLLGLLIGIFRIFSWLVGGSALLLLIYQRILLPRISRSSAARTSLKTHQISLLTKLNQSLSALKDKHTEDLAELPRRNPWEEPEEFAGLQSIQEVSQQLENPNMTHIVPPTTLLRCALADFSRDHELPPTTHELFQLMEVQIPWLVTEEGLQYEQVLWETLQNCDLFTSEAIAKPTDVPDHVPEESRWSYHQPHPKAPAEVIVSLTQLAGAIPRPSKEISAPKHTHKALTDMTGYISSQVYAPYRPHNGVHGGQGGLSPQQDELRKEIRALKGLVLNRRSFMSSITRPESIAAK